MVDTPFSQLRNESPGHYVPATDACTQMTYEDFILLKPTRDASTQTTEDFFDLLAQFQSGRTITTGNLESAVDTSETVFSGFHEYRNNCDVVKTAVEDVSSSMGASTNFDMSSGTKNNVEFSEFCMQLEFLDNFPHYSGQSTQQEENSTASNQSTPTADYPAVHMECRTSNNYVCSINEAPRNENVDIFHPRGPEPRNVAAESYMPLEFPENIAHYSRQNTQYESNKNDIFQGTHIVDYPVEHMECRTSNNYVSGINEAPGNENVDIFHTRGPESKNLAAESYMPLTFPENIAHYSRQSTQYSSNKNTLIQDTHTLDFPAVSHQSNHSSRQHTQENGSRNACAQGTQLLKSSVLSSSKLIFTCEKCGRRFSKEFSLNAHILSNCETKPCKCDECGMEFPSENKLTLHYEIHGEKSFKCSKCDYATYKEVNLKMHFNNMHKK